MAINHTVAHTTGATVYAMLWRNNPSGGALQIWNGSAWATYATGSFASYDIAATEIGTASGVYAASLPDAAIVTGTPVTVEYRAQAGGSPAESDAQIERLEWVSDGTRLLPAAYTVNISAIASAATQMLLTADPTAFVMGSPEATVADALLYARASAAAAETQSTSAANQTLAASIREALGFANADADDQLDFIVSELISIGETATDAATYAGEVNSKLTTNRASYLDKLNVAGTLLHTSNVNVSDGTVEANTTTMDSEIVSAIRDGVAMASDVPTDAQVAAAVWSDETRTLSSGTNIVLAKGTGVTGFNDPSSSDNAAAVWGTGSKIITGGTITTNNDKTGYGLADGAITSAKFGANAITAATLASDVTTELQSGLATQASVDLLGDGASVLWSGAVSDHMINSSTVLHSDSFSPEIVAGESEQLIGKTVKYTDAAGEVYVRTIVAVGSGPLTIEISPALSTTPEEGDAFTILLDSGSAVHAKLPSDGAKMAGEGTTAKTLDDVSGGGGDVTIRPGGGVLLARVSDSSIYPEKFLEIVQGEQKTITLIIQSATGAFDQATPDLIKFALSDVEGNVISYTYSPGDPQDDASFELVANELDLQVFRVTLASEDTVELSPGVANIAVTVDTQKTRVPQAIKIVSDIN